LPWGVGDQSRFGFIVTRPKDESRRVISSLSSMETKVGLVVLSQKVARFDFENQLFEKIQDWRARC
jgi:hypothetical protein